MNYETASKKLSGYRDQIAELRKKTRAVQASVRPQPVEDYEFSTTRGTIRLSGLFGEKNDLFVIHNMGASCPYCTLWADGYNGVYDHLANRAAFVVSSPDAPAAQKKFARSRGWRFPMISHRGTTFARDMGYGSEKEGWRPGVSVFRKERGHILRVSDASFAPGDDYCALWHFFDLLPGGPGNWRPKFKYA
ncbi:MAG: DUF899 domain-containing protein [Alphaproteobacteria bacterium]|nr:DUF899 domain-containing protein [Alphaproteobacteria bacterium]MBM3732587.1 DUF899 domain-containing protein [Acidimicrobiia bacterium]